MKVHGGRNYAESLASPNSGHISEFGTNEKNENIALYMPQTMLPGAFQQPLFLF